MGYRKTYGNHYVTGGALVAGNSTFQGNVDIEGTLTAVSITATSDLQFESISATSKLTSNNLLTATSKATVTKTLTASSGFIGTAASSFSGTLKVDNLLTATSKATVTKTLTASSGFIGTAASSFSGTLKVDNTLTASSGFLGTANSSFSGTLKVDNTLTASSGFLGTANSSFSGTLKVDNTLTASSGHVVPTQTLTTANILGGASPTTVKSYGVTLFSGTGGGEANLYQVGAPVAGQVKWLVNGSVSSNSTSYRVARTQTAVTINTTGAVNLHKIKMAKPGTFIGLVGVSATKWQMIARAASTCLILSASTSNTG